VTHPQTDDQLTRFFRWLTHTHAMRWRVAHQTVGFGHLYQGRFKNFPAQRDEHALTLCRYVERNALSAGLVRRAEQWRWCSLWARENGSDELKSILAPWPVERPDDWIDVVNRAISSRELDRLKLSMQRSRPYGSDAWTHRTVARLGLRHTLRSEGRPRKPKKTK
jgi:putative transposase